MTRRKPEHKKYSIGHFLYAHFNSLSLATDNCLVKTNTHSHCQRICIFLWFYCPKTCLERWKLDLFTYFWCRVIQNVTIWHHRQHQNWGKSSPFCSFFSSVIAQSFHLFFFFISIGWFVRTKNASYCVLKAVIVSAHFRFSCAFTHQNYFACISQF